MRISRLVYSEAITGLGRDPVDLAKRPALQLQRAEQTRGSDEMAVKTAVEAALQCLDTDEREFVRCYYFMGWTLLEISDLTGRTVARLEVLQKRTHRRLRTLLGPFVAARYGIGRRPTKNCPVCTAAAREEIEEVLAAKRPADTWGVVMRELRKRFGLTVGSPQTLISHVKYHTKQTPALPDGAEGDLR